MNQKKRNILLVYPPMDGSYYTEGVNDSPPLGLVVLENYARRKLAEPLDIRIIDGEHNTLNHIMGLVRDGNFDLVGIQPMMASYRSAIQIAEVAKDTGAMVIFGGHHATHLAECIADRRRDLVDCVVCGDGEEAFVGILRGDAPATIPNLVYWDKDLQKTVATPARNVPIDEGRITHFAHDLLQQYRHGETKLERGDAGSFRSYSHKGCHNRMNSEYCFFCGRADRGFRLKSPEVYLSELRYLSKAHHAEYVFEIGDDFLQDMDWLAEIVRQKKNRFNDVSLHLKIFSRANRITPEIIKLLKQLDVDEVAIGFESGSRRILENINKRIDPDQNLEAARLLFSSGIDTVSSFVLGLPGEDDESLEETYDMAMRVTEMAYRYLGRAPQEVIANLIEINPGAPSFRRLQAAFPDRYTGTDSFDVRETQDDYFRLEFGFRTMDEINERRACFAQWSKKINKLGMYTFPAGWVKEDMMEAQVDD